MNADAMRELTHIIHQANILVEVFEMDKFSLGSIEWFDFFME